MLVKDVKDKMFASIGIDSKESLDLYIGPNLDSIDFSWINKLKFSNITYNFNHYDNQKQGVVGGYHVITFKDVGKIELTIENKIKNEFWQYINSKLEELEENHIGIALKEIFSYFNVERKLNKLNDKRFNLNLALLIFLNYCNEVGLLEDIIGCLKLVNQEIIVSNNVQKIFTCTSTKDYVEVSYKSQNPENNFNELDYLYFFKFDFLQTKEIEKDSNFIIAKLLNPIYNYEENSAINFLINYFMENDLFIGNWTINLDEIQICLYKNSFIPKIDISNEMECVQKLNLELNNEDTKYFNIFNLNEFKNRVCVFLGTKDEKSYKN